MMKFIPKLIAVSALAVVAAQANAATATLTGNGTLTAIAPTTTFVNSTYSYSGLGTGSGGSYSGTYDQEITNILGLSTIFADLSFDALGVGTQTITDCTGAALVCAAVLPAVGFPQLYATGPQTATIDGFTYEQIFVVETDAGPASSASNIQITYAPEVPLPAAAWLFGSALLGLVGIKRRKQS